MGIWESIKKIILPKAKEIVNNLNLDDAATGLLGDLAGKLDGLKAEGKLSELADKALEAFKSALSAFKVDPSKMTALLEKGKALLGSLEGIELPEEVSGLVEKAKALLK